LLISQGGTAAWAALKQLQEKDPSAKVISTFIIENNDIVLISLINA
jgi:hypothetical protein